MIPSCQSLNGVLTKIRRYTFYFNVESFISSELACFCRIIKVTRISQVNI